MYLNHYEETSPPCLSNEKRKQSNIQISSKNQYILNRSRDMKQKIMHKILESSQKKQQQQQQIKYTRSRITSIDLGNQNIQQLNDLSIQQEKITKDLINSIKQELRNQSDKISQIQRQCQINESFQLETINEIDNKIQSATILKSQGQDLKKSNLSEILDFKQINLEKYKQLLGELKDLIKVEKNDIIKEIQENMDEDYEQSIKQVKMLLNEIENQKIQLSQAYNLEKCEINNFSERKSMLKEDLNGKLMQRAELVAQREYLDEILEEFKQKYKLEIEYIEEENKIQSVVNNQNQQIQQITQLKKQKQQTSQSLLSQIYQKNDQLFDLYQLLCNSYLTKVEQINANSNIIKNLEQGLNGIFNKHQIPTFNNAQILKASRQNGNQYQITEDPQQNWPGFSHLNFTDKRRFKDEFYKLKNSHKQRFRQYCEWCDLIYKCDTSQKLQISQTKKVISVIPQKVENETILPILQSFCEDKGITFFEIEKIINIFIQYQKTLFEQNQFCKIYNNFYILYIYSLNKIVDEDRIQEQDYMIKIEEQEKEILFLQEKKKQIEKDQLIHEEDIYLALVSFKQNQQLISQKKQMLDHNLHLQADSAFTEYLLNEKQIFITLEKTYGMKAASQIKKEHHKQFIEKMKETQNKRINQLKKIFSDLYNLNKNISMNLSYVENTLFIELNNIEQSLILFKRSLEIKEKELKQIINKENEFKLKLNIINEAKKIYFDNIQKIEATNIDQMISINQNEQSTQMNNLIEEENNQITNTINIKKSKIQNYFQTYRTNENQYQDKKQYNTIDQIGHKDSIESVSYRISDKKLPQSYQTIDETKSKSRNIFSTIDCTSIDETNNDENFNQKTYYFNMKGTKHQIDTISKSLDNSRRGSICHISSLSGKRQSLNSIVSKPQYQYSDQKNINKFNEDSFYSRSLINYSSSKQNYIPISQIQQLGKQNNNNNNSVLQPKSTNIPTNYKTTKDFDESEPNYQIKEQFARYQHKIVKFNLNNTQLKHIQILESIKPLLEGREIFKRIGNFQHGSGTSTINQQKNQFNPFSQENPSLDQCGYVQRVAHLNRHLTKIEFRNYQFSQKGQKQMVPSLDSSISVDHMLRLVIPSTTLDLIKFQKHFDVIGNNNQKSIGLESINSNQLNTSAVMNTHNTTKQNDQAFVNNPNTSFRNQFTSNYQTLSSNGANVNGSMINYSNLSIIQDQNQKIEKILHCNLYPFQIVMDKGNRLEVIAENYETYKMWINSINILIKYRKALNQLKNKIEFIVI